MPRPRTETRTLGREAVVKALLADPFGVLDMGADHELLTEYTPADRGAIIAEVERREWAQREAQREPVLLERLKTWPVSQLGNVFCERPDLEAQLTPERKREWAAWLRQVKESSESNGKSEETNQ